MTTFGLRIGDVITFRSATRWGCKKATRIINDFWNGEPTVRYGGWNNFIVHYDEIISVDRRKADE